ncbi:MAG: hypothetical protein H7222_13365 [Methylotenera sp.]|nr:hypothetical protein [Oligoflexia bacterium]
MPNPQNIKRFRANPVEVTILAVMALILCNSVYRLFDERADFKFAALSPMTAQPTQGAHRSPASVIPEFASLDINCDSRETSSEQRTAAGKVRLTGPLCLQNSQPGSDSAASQLVKSQISNTANRFNATVFTDVSASRFSTDYIPLVPGRNLIEVEFTYKSNKFTRSLSVFNSEETASVQQSALTPAALAPAANTTPANSTITR